jgi:hypothetical protein
MIILLVAVLSMGLAALLGRLLLGGILRLTFQRARDFVRRAIERRGSGRRHTQRGEGERRAQNRRIAGPPQDR